MSEISFIGVLISIILIFFYSVCATITINKIVGPDSVRIGFAKEIILDCDYEFENESNVIIKWYFFDDPIYQWMTFSDEAFSMGPLKDVVDTKFKISNDPKIMYRALRIKEFNTSLSGNYTCKVESFDVDEFLSKQVIVYSPASKFEIYLIGNDDDLNGNEIVFCEITDVSPKPNFDIMFQLIDNTTVELPETFTVTKEVKEDDNERFNISMQASFNSSYLEPGTSKFLCSLSIAGTNYEQIKSVEIEHDSEAEPSEFQQHNNEDYPSFNSKINDSTKIITADEYSGGNGGQQSRSQFSAILLIMAILLILKI